MTDEEVKRLLELLGDPAPLPWDAEMFSNEWIYIDPESGAKNRAEKP